MRRDGAPSEAFTIDDLLLARRSLAVVAAWLEVVAPSDQLRERFGNIRLTGRASAQTDHVGMRLVLQDATWKKDDNDNSPPRQGPVAVRRSCHNDLGLYADVVIEPMNAALTLRDVELATCNSCGCVGYVNNRPDVANNDGLPVCDACRVLARLAPAVVTHATATD
jgi:hypothetical protein